MAQEGLSLLRIMLIVIAEENGILDFIGSHIGSRMKVKVQATRLDQMGILYFTCQVVKDAVCIQGGKIAVIKQTGVAYIMLRWVVSEQQMMQQSTSDVSTKAEIVFKF